MTSLRKIVVRLALLILLASCALGSSGRAEAEETPFSVSAYSICDGSTPCHGLTASGRRVQAGVTVAADWRVFEPGSWVDIDGVGRRRVDDRGGAIKGRRLDLYMNTRAEATAFGRADRGARLAPGPAADERAFPVEREGWAKGAWCHAVPALGGGWWTAGHCTRDKGRLYVDGDPVTAWSVDPTRDLAHLVTGAPASPLSLDSGSGGGAVHWRTDGGKTEAHLAGPRIFTHDASGRGWWDEGSEAGAAPGSKTQTLLVACVTGGVPLRVGNSGAGAFTESGALVGVLVGGDVPWNPEAGWSRPDCDRLQRVLIQGVP